MSDDLRLGRRELIAAAALGAAVASPVAATPLARRKPAPPGFLWGTAISAYQSEGNNTNADAWLKSSSVGASLPLYAAIVLAVFSR